MGKVLLQTHDRLVAELNTCCELTQKLNEQLDIMTSTVEMARSRKEQVLASREEVSNHLKDLKNLVVEREREVRLSGSDNC